MALTFFEQDPNRPEKEESLRALSEADLLAF